MTRSQVSATNLRNLQKLLLLNVFAPEEIGGRIAQAREEAGLTQPELADLIGVSMRQVQNYEAGASKPYRKIREIAGATKRSVEWLLHGEPAEATPDDFRGLEDRLLAAIEAQRQDLVDLVLEVQREFRALRDELEPPGSARDQHGA